MDGFSTGLAYGLATDKMLERPAGGGGTGTLHGVFFYQTWTDGRKNIHEFSRWKGLSHSDFEWLDIGFLWSIRHGEWAEGKLLWSFWLHHAWRLQFRKLRRSAPVIQDVGTSFVVDLGKWTGAFRGTSPIFMADFRGFSIAMFAASHDDTRNVIVSSVTQPKITEAMPSLVKLMALIQ